MLSKARGSLARYLTSDSLASPLSGSKGLGVYLEPRDAMQPEKPHEANYKQVFSDQYSGGLGRYVQDGTK